ncbi:P-loop containing nucleoside triphosphate hydrolase protein [Rhizoctonia solani]|uniref:P-loop containing nucleoside triphosphate hydrolase protein n=1 Tax=Rhizoctonia solani TaxID=456999 RepID=A0A8H7HDC9_9AGAM|nr:P-loop containing nucleoside triphosphate hydrolase protein [Rhizoctonia solani]
MLLILPAGGLLGLELAFSHSQLSWYLFALQGHSHIQSPKNAKLDYSQLPPLAFYDRADFLRRRGSAKLDPLSQPNRHLFWGIVDVFWKEYCVMMGMIVVKATELVGPLGIRYILRLEIYPIAGSLVYHWALRYLEDPPQPGYFRPWVWILLLFLGPIIGAIAMQRYVFITCGMVVRVDAIITQVLFDHSLRIRMAEDSSSDSVQKSFQGIEYKRGALALTTEEQKRPTSYLIGRIHNLMSTTTLRHTKVEIPAYRDFSAIIGLVCMILLLFVPGKVVRLINKIQIEWAKKTDSRVQLIIESLNTIRTIKLFAWEVPVKSQLKKKRQEELSWYQKRQFAGLFTVNINYALPLVVMLVTFLSHTLVFKEPLDASSIFSSISVFDILRTQLRLLLLQIPSSIQSKVSLDRTNDFLTKTELLDCYERIGVEAVTPNESAIGFCNAGFTWSSVSLGSSTLRQSFQLQIDGELLFQRQSINMIIGPTGCGKTSLLMALLGEMHYTPNGANSWASALGGKSVAYSPQEPWIQNATIRENILFGENYDEERYAKVISQCSLERDLELLESGDQTEVGERGMTLSGGQRARVSLARAIYYKSEVIILDDVLSALDVHTSHWVVDKCFRGDIVAGRTVIIVTHSVSMISEIANFIVVLGPGGRIVNQGTIETVLGSNPKLKDEVAQQIDSEDPQPNRELTETAPKGSSADGRMTTAEEVAKGHVGWSALKLFFFALGGAGFWFVYMAGFIFANMGSLFQTYWLGIWARAYDTNMDQPERVNVSFYLGVYSTICLCGMVLYSLAFMIHIIGSIRAARRIHEQLVSSVFSATLYWLDCTPIGRVISRFTQDIRSIDGSLPNVLQNLTDMTIQLVSRFVAIILVSYAPCSPLQGHISDPYAQPDILIRWRLALGTRNMDGPSIHIRPTPGQTTHVQRPFPHIQPLPHRFGRNGHYSRVWSSREDAKGNAKEDRHAHESGEDVLEFKPGLAAWLVYGRNNSDASDAGFSLNTAIALSGGILWWVRTLNEFQVQTNSLERIHSYLTIPHEPSSEQHSMPPAYWPASGTLTVHNLGAQYGNGPRVLDNLSFQVKHGERVGIVGRTGSGKSSLVLAFGIETRSIPLESLRSNVTVVPQQPELTSGTLRENLDPFGECDDGVLWDALKAAGLSNSGPHSENGSRTQSDSELPLDQTATTSSTQDQEWIGLDTRVGPSGANLSLGQRQMVALARAIVRRTKLVILDEATAAIDHETDQRIHRALGSVDQTVLVVAHRLRTICNVDKVMVLDAGRMVEYDSPKVLLRKQGSAFKSLVDGSGERDELYMLIEGGSASREYDE